MAEAAAAPPRGLLEIPAVKQLVLLVALAGAIAAALWLVFWSQGGTYAPVYSQLSERETAQVADALAALGVPYRLGPDGAITVPEAQVREARMRLAAQGLPESDALGVELIQKESGFGTSQFMEGARYQLAMETELARTIVKMQGVQSARVHLAVPRQSAFVRDKRQATASVMLQLFPGRRLERGQVQAIVHLVASSVPDLEAGDVTVVDHNGSLLSAPDAGDPLAASAKQLEYTRAIEDGYARRIENLLVPLVGAGSVRAGVTAEVDFTVVEQTSEDLVPEQQVVRSEQTASDQRLAGEAAVGVPGALSNQPPRAGGQPTAGAPPAGDAAPPQPVATTQRATRNFEIDRTVSHVKQPTGTVRRLFAAVVIDHKRVTGADGKVTLQPLAAEELARYESLVREAIGFDEARGDRVQVVNASFSVDAAPAALPAEPWYANPLFRQYARQGLTALLVLIVALFVLRPIMKSLLGPPPPPPPPALAMVAQAAPAPGELERDRVTISAPQAMPVLPGYEEHVAVARSVATENPKRAARIVREWMNDNGK
ncbi:MAG: flagellar basal-body MS-ring/collar protein FliF [Pseudomonadota bacterium]